MQYSHHTIIEFSTFDILSTRETLNTLLRTCRYTDLAYVKILPYLSHIVLNLHEHVKIWKGFLSFKTCHILIRQW